MFSNLNIFKPSHLSWHCSNVKMRIFKKKKDSNLNDDYDFLEIIRELENEIAEIVLTEQFQKVFDSRILVFRPLTSLIYNKLKAQFLELCEKDSNAIHSA